MNIYFLGVYFFFIFGLLGCKQQCDYCNLLDFNYRSMTCNRVDSTKGSSKYLNSDRDIFIKYKHDSLYVFLNSSIRPHYIEEFPFKKIKQGVYVAKFYCLTVFIEENVGIWLYSYRFGSDNVFVRSYKITDWKLYKAEGNKGFKISDLERFEMLKKKSYTEDSYMPFIECVR
jgi:hypothetical protein